MLIDQPLTSLAERLSTPVDVLKGAAILIAGYPFGILYLLIPSSTPFIPARHAFSIVASCLLFFAFFDVTGFFELLAMALIFYAATYFGRKNRRVPFYLFLYAIGHLSWKYLYTQVFVVSAAKFDHTVIMMMLVIKLTSFAWSVYDGTRSEDELWDEHKSSTIRRFPGLLEFFGYVFFFPTFSVGPAIEFRAYQEYINSEPPFDRMPSRVVPVLRSLGIAVLSTVIFVKFGATINYDSCNSKEFLEEFPFWKKVLYMQFAGLVARSKFYAAWNFSAGACNLTGFGYSGNGEWTRGENVDIIGFELAPTPKDLVAAWNLRTNIWLRKSVYLRVVQKPPRGAAARPGPFATFITYLVSAVWHGFHPGYYLFFLIAVIFNLVGRTLHRNLRPFVFAPRSPLRPLLVPTGLYAFLGWLGCTLTINFLVVPFVLWRIDVSLRIWRAVAFAPLLALVAVWGVMDGFGIGRVLRGYAVRWGGDGGARRDGSRGGGKEARGPSTKSLQFEKGGDAADDGVVLQERKSAADDGERKPVRRHVRREE
ncbi:MBOAT, membrane-bound O-acyltransferase family-domain-containing protein [Zopfochytrium polystomum]|nr:MBOAT, membrane-bound O-acyltransferase family-domain-containing protein [Zopfochytrium polystomum]